MCPIARGHKRPTANMGALSPRAKARSTVQIPSRCTGPSPRVTVIGHDGWPQISPKHGFHLFWMAAGGKHLNSRRRCSIIPLQCKPKSYNHTWPKASVLRMTHVWPSKPRKGRTAAHTSSAILYYYGSILNVPFCSDSVQKRRKL